MASLISGIQQIGIGVSNVHEAWAWYRKNLNFDVPVFEEAAEAALMINYTGNKVQSRHAILALNLQGGGGFEIWQYTSRVPQASEQEPKIGDYGINACIIKCRSAQKAHDQLSKVCSYITEIEKNPSGESSFFIKDPYNNLFLIREATEWFGKENAKNSNIGGVYGALIGVRDIEKSIKFYKEILGYDETVFDTTNKFNSIPKNKKCRRVCLTHQAKRLGGFSELLGKTQIELIQVEDSQNRNIFDNRYWGDLGYIHLCFDVIDMKELREKCNSFDSKFTVDSENSFDMGEAAGHFAYIEDPDRTLIEFVETHKIPIIKKIGWYLDLRKRDKLKPLPKLIIKALGLNRKS